MGKCINNTENISGPEGVIPSKSQADTALDVMRHKQETFNALFVSCQSIIQTEISTETHAIITRHFDAVSTTSAVDASSSGEPADPMENTANGKTLSLSGI